MSVMQNPYKYLILAVLLVLPVFLFLYLFGFGQNYYRLPVYFATDSAQRGNRWLVTKAHSIPDFEFTDQKGKIFKRSSLKDKIFVVDFFFTQCGNPNFCPKMSSELARVQEAFKKESEIRILSFTVDPENDRPEVLNAYAQKYNAKDGKWLFLTGEKKKIYQLAQKGFFVTAGEESTDVTPDFVHTSKFVLVDRKGWIRGYYDGTSREEVDRLILEIQILLHSAKTGQ